MKKRSVGGGLLLGAGLGALSGLWLLGDQVTAESRLVVGDQTIQAQAVPGYALATQQLASTYSRLVSSDAVSAATPADVDVTASPVPDSAVIRIQASGQNAQGARAAADAAADALVTAVERTRGIDERSLQAWQSARDDLREAQRRAAAATAPSAQRRAQAQDAVELQRLRVEALAQSYKDDVMAAASGSTALTVTQRAAVTTTSAPRGGLLGAFAGGVAAALLLGLLHLRKGRRRG